MARYIHETSMGTLVAGNAVTSAPGAATVGHTVDNHPSVLLTSAAADDSCTFVLWAKDRASESWVADAVVGTQTVTPAGAERLLVDVRGISEIVIQITGVGGHPGTLTVSGVKVGP